MFYVASKFHDNSINTFGFIEGWGRGGGRGHLNSEKAKAE